MVDPQTVRRAARHDAEAFGDLLRSCRGLVYSISLSYAADVDTAEDLTQDAFVTAYEQLPKLRDPERFVPWVKRLTENVCRMWLRRKPPPTVADDGDPPQAATDALAPETKLVVGEALQAISKQSRLVLGLHYGAGQSYREIANMLAVDEDRVRSRLHEARSQLRRELLKTIGEILRTCLASEELADKVLSRCAGVECQCAAELLRP